MKLLKKTTINKKVRASGNEGKKTAPVVFRFILDIKQDRLQLSKILKLVVKHITSFLNSIFSGIYHG